MSQIVLIIEDSKAQARMVEGLLKFIGCQTTLAYNGAEAIEKFESQQYDLILLDMILPDASGLQLLRIIKASEKNANTNVVVLSGVTDKGNIMDALALGASDYIAKPFFEAEFISRINVHLENQRLKTEIAMLMAKK